MLSCLRPVYLTRLTSALCRCRYLHREEQISVYGLPINTVQTGKGNKALLLMPGALGSAWTDFRPQIEGLPALLPDFNIIAWDPPGCGKSMPEMRKFSADLFADDANYAIDLMQTLNFGNFSILGWNTGGTTALVMAGRFPQFVDKVVVWGASAYFSISELERLNALRGLGSSCRLPSLKKPLEELYGQERFAAMWSCYLGAVTQIIQERKGDFCRAEVDCIQAPTFILHGSEDPIITREHIDYLLKHIKQSKLHEFSDGSHDLHLNFPVQFNELVAKFLIEPPKKIRTY